MKKFFYSLMAAAALVACSGEYVPVDTFIEAEDPVALTEEQEAAWDGVSKKFNAARPVR